MTQTQPHTETSAPSTINSVFLPLGATSDCIYGLHVSPFVVYVNQRRIVAAPRIGARGLLDERQISEKRRSALVEGRKRLASITAAMNQGGGTLAELRLRAGLSQLDVAEKLNKKQPNIARLEKHPGNVSLETITELASALNCEVGDVLKAIIETNRRVESHV